MWYVPLMSPVHECSCQLPARSQQMTKGWCLGCIVSFCAVCSRKQLAAHTARRGKPDTGWVQKQTTLQGATHLKLVCVMDNGEEPGGGASIRARWACRRLDAAGRCRYYLLLLRIGRSHKINAVSRRDLGQVAKVAKATLLEVVVHWSHCKWPPVVARLAAWLSLAGCQARCL